MTDDPRVQQIVYGMLATNPRVYIWNYGVYTSERGVADAITSRIPLTTNGEVTFPGPVYIAEIDNKYKITRHVRKIRWADRVPIIEDWQK